VASFLSRELTDNNYHALPRVEILRLNYQTSAGGNGGVRTRSLSLYSFSIESATHLELARTAEARLKGFSRTSFSSNLPYIHQSVYIRREFPITLQDVGILIVVET